MTLIKSNIYSLTLYMNINIGDQYRKNAVYTFEFIFKTLL